MQPKELAIDSVLRGQLEAAQMRMTRGQYRRLRREVKAQQYAAVGLNGKRAVFHRQRQIAAGSLRVENGLVL